MAALVTVGLRVRLEAKPGKGAGRQAHLAGRLAEALFARARELLAHAPTVEHVDVLAAKLG